MVFATQKKYKYQATSKHNILVKEVLSGNRQSANDLYAILLVFVKSIIHNKAYKMGYEEKLIIAHDLVSFVFEKLYLYDENKTNLFGGAGSIATNKLIDIHRKNKKTISFNLNDNEDILISLTEITTPETILINNEKLSQLELIMAKLPKEKRSLLAGYLDGKTMQELSLLFGKNAGALTTELYRIKKTIKLQFIQ